MGGKTDKIKGRIKEAAGVLTGNDRLRKEGKIDVAVGKTKQALKKTADKDEKHSVNRIIG
ncbi:MAG: CsbD family protein [Planctomycetaceae bacterium]|nr:MAG: CsbD family protein [Planctomycetaceae bacterium]